MRDYRITRVRVRVRYLDNGQSEWFEADLDPDCRDVVIGLDAAGIAGSYDPPTRPRLLQPIPEPEPGEPLGTTADREEAVRAVSTREQQAKPAAEPTGSTQYQAMSTSTAAATTTRLPDSCQYINGRWYCWIEVA